MVLVMVFAALPQSLMEEEGQAWRHEESLMDLEVGATSSQLV